MSENPFLLSVEKVIRILLVVFFMMLQYHCKRSFKPSAELASTPSDFEPGTPPNDYVEINSSIAVMGAWDYTLVDGSSPCLEMVDKALGSDFANSTINFLPTHGFLVDPPHDGTEKIVTASLQEFRGAKPLTWGNRICYRVSERACNPPTLAMIKTFEDGMAACFEKVFSKGRGISITPHVDDGKREGRWRNSHALGLVIEGDWECEKYVDSYYCAMLVPIANAIKRTRITSLPVYFSAQGEMGATVFAYTSQYSHAIALLRESLDPRSDDPKIKFGISLNFNKIFGNFPTQYLSSRAFKELLKKLDFFGASAYTNLTLAADGSLPFLQFDQVFNSVNQELAAIKTDLKKDASHLELIFSEVGIGGSVDSKKPATSGRDALSAPWAGIHGTFNPKTNPWSDPDVANGAIQFYCGLSLYLSKNLVPSASPWRERVKGAFIWNLASWDIQGLYHTSSVAKQGSYLIPEVGLAIKKYNETGVYRCPTQKFPRDPSIVN